MNALNTIQKPIVKDLEKFEPFFRQYMKSKAPLLDIITNYILRRKGKQMRPMLVFLSAKLLGDINPSTYNAAALVELLHTATLIHDDVVDESHERRGMFSVNALWKNKIAVLVGDYLLSKGLLLAVDNNEHDLLKILSEAVKEMSEGELLQIEKARKLDISEDIYFDIIKKKTATLIASCTASGARSVDASVDVVAKLKEFGEHMGIAFQIKDDIFDYQKSGLIGKPTGNDIKEKKMTLPLIYVLNNASGADKRRIMRTIRKNNNDSKKVSEVIDFVISNGGIEYANKIMNKYRDKALHILNEFPDSEAKESLTALAHYFTTRKK